MFSILSGADDAIDERPPGTHKHMKMAMTAWMDVGLRISTLVQFVILRRVTNRALVVGTAVESKSFWPRA
jgi:beta-lactamase class D